MMTRIALEGIDGSGKTTIANELARQLAKEGVSSLVATPFRAANERLGENVYGLWRTWAGAHTGMRAIRDAIALAEEEAVDTSTDVILYDRHWMSVLTEIRDFPSLVAAWGDTYVPAALLRTSPAAASRRINNDQHSPWSSVLKQATYAVSFQEIAQENPGKMLGIYRNEGDVSVEAIAKTINWDMHILR